MISGDRTSAIMSLEGILLRILAILSCTLLSLAFTDDEFEIASDSLLTVEHTFDRGPNPTFTKRGTIAIRSIKTGIAEHQQERSLTNYEVEKLQKLVEIDGPYRIKVSSKTPAGTTRYVSAFIKACSLYESGLTDTLLVNVDQSNNLIGVSITTPLPYCLGITMPNERLSDFNTTVEVFQTVPGPAPETQFFVEKMERERAEKTKGQQQDNRSFLGKYWMYIIPLVVLLMFANNADPNAQGGGSGGGGR